MKDEIKPREAPAVAYINRSMAAQMHDGFTCKGERNKESRNRQKKEALVLLLVENLKICCKLAMDRPRTKIEAGALTVASPALQHVMCVYAMWSHGCLLVYTNVPPFKPFSSLCKWSILPA